MAAARLDRVLAWLYPGCRARSENRVGSGTEQLRHAAPGLQLLSHLRTRCSGTTSSGATVGCRSAHADYTLHAGIRRDHGGPPRSGDRAIPADVRDGSVEPHGATVLRLGADHQSPPGNSGGFAEVLPSRSARHPPGTALILS